jgi:hypothetical protein
MLGGGGCLRVVITSNIIEIEGMAMNGLVSRVRLEECERPPGWKKIIAETSEGKTLETSCMEPDAAKRNYMVLLLYVRQWGKLVFGGEEVEGRPEEP